MSLFQKRFKKLIFNLSFVSLFVCPCFSPTVFAQGKESSDTQPQRYEFNCGGNLDFTFANRFQALGARVFARLLGLNEMSSILKRVLARDQSQQVELVRLLRSGKVIEGLDSNFFVAFKNDMKLNVVVSEQDLARIPKDGPLITVGNHPHGIPDGLATVSALVAGGRTNNIKSLSNSSAIGKGSEENFIYIDTSKDIKSRAGNMAVMRAMKTHLKSKGNPTLMTFPAGVNSRYRNNNPYDFRDPQWPALIPVISKLTKATILPMHIEYVESSRISRAMSALRFRPLDKLVLSFLAQEVLSLRGATIRVRIGNPVSPDQIEAWVEKHAEIENSPYESGLAYAADQLYRITHGLLSLIHI